jgi:hypothetical protein
MQRIITLAERKGYRGGAAGRGGGGAAAGIGGLCPDARRTLLVVRVRRPRSDEISQRRRFAARFPPEALSEAWSFAETACWDLRLEPDLLPYAGCKPAFLEHISSDVQVLA